MKLIQRSYLQTLLNIQNTPDIKVITGVRRSGKSKLLEAFTRELKKNPENNIIHINLIEEKNTPLLEAKPLYDCIKKHYKPEKHNIVCIDEIQLCKNFEKAISWLHVTEKYDIYITGSNAFLLSSDLATLFTGRTFEIQIYPFSFAEYVKYYESEDIFAAFDEYLKWGGMAGSYNYKNPEQKRKYVSDIYQTLIVRDIKQKFSIKNSPLLDNLTSYLMDTTGCQTSLRKIAETLNANGEKTNDKTISSYVEYLCNAFLFYRIRRYDIQGKRYLSTQDKYYLCDNSFRYARLGTKNMNYGRMLENIVAIELLRRGYEIYAGTLYTREIDFVALKQDEKIYIQVSDDISGEETFKREYTPLLAIHDAYPKLILARTHHETYDYEGIKIQDISRWLLDIA
ncbi:MAG TPA: ATP-binding protein [Methanocorpusculum sp.]|nr:ATP-binding protein [Methanocorpusculum sp.]